MNQLSIIRVLESMVLLFDGYELDSYERQLVVQLFMRLETECSNEGRTAHKMSESSFCTE